MHTPSGILKTYWGYDSFRSPQKEIIKSVLDGNDTLVLLPTGGGKSVCFQVPALCLEGICIVVSPLIALMKDQVSQLQKRGIKAIAITSGMTKKEIDISLDNCIYGEYKFLYVSPERLKTELFIERARKMNISLLAIDEAHCISQWGYDFRPQYLDIASFKNELIINKIIALTATATREVKQDIISKLELTNVQIFTKSFARKNLSYSAFNLENKEQKLIEILKNVNGSSVIYCQTRRKTQQISDFLRLNNIQVTYYHGGLSTQERANRQEAWISNKKRVIVATNAFGMGIDKGDVRTVIHLDIPESLEAYYQEAGRAGRDGKNAFAVALYNQQDLELIIKKAEQSIPKNEIIKKTYQSLANYFQLAIGSHPENPLPFDYLDFINKYNLSSLETYNSLKILENEGFIILNESFHKKDKIHFLINQKETYKFQVANQNLDLIIKVILRLYGGSIFSEYVNVNINDINKLLKNRLENTYKQLNLLQKHGVIDFIKSSESAKISFILPRQNTSNLQINEAFLKKRRELAINKAQSVIKYLQTTGCRTNVFQKYFDETPSQDCGICDNDLKLKNHKNTSFKLPLKEVCSFLTTQKSYLEIKANFSKYSEKELIESLRILEEEGRITEKNGIFSQKKTTLN